LREEALEKWKNRLGSIPPKSAIFVFNIKKDRTEFVHGGNVLGYANDKSFTGAELGFFFHDNQRDILLYMMYSLHELIVGFNGYKIDFYYVSKRAVKDINGKYWYAVQTTEPFQYDENGKLLSYLSWYHILTEYEGEPLEANFHCRNLKGDEKTIEKLEIAFSKIKSEILPTLGFTRMQRQVLKYLAGGCSTKETAEILELSESGVEYHNENILKLGKTLFPINNFKYASDVAFYLRKQNFV
jgi:hypothetical protein